MKKVNLSVVFSFCLVVSNLSFADSLDTLLSDANKRITTVENNGAYKAKPIKDSWGGYHSEYEPVIAKCPAGTKLVPKASRCDYSSLSLATYLYFIKEEKSNMKDGQQECGATVYYPSIEAYNSFSADVHNIKSIANCAKLPKAVSTILNRFGVNNF